MANTMPNDNDNNELRGDWESRYSGDNRILGAEHFRREAVNLEQAASPAARDDVTDLSQTAQTLQAMGKTSNIATYRQATDPPDEEQPEEVPEAFAELVAVPHLAGVLANSSDRALKIHDDLLKEIKTFVTIAACVTLYESAYFQECIILLRTAQMEHLSSSNPAVSSSPIQARENWAETWAKALARDEEWAWALNRCRKTALKLLYRVCDLCFGFSKDGKLTVNDQLLQTFASYRFNQILKHCLVMDRANALFNMINTDTDQRGLGWYSPQDQARYQALREPPLPLNPEVPTINRRLKWLQQSGLYGPNDAWFQKWMEIEAPPPPSHT